MTAETHLEPDTWDAIDPFAPLHGGVYRGARLDVRAQTGPAARRGLHMLRTTHFDVTHVGARLEVVHRVPPERVDDDLSGLLAAELFHPGWLRGPELFERLFAGVVLTSGGDALDAWTRFYRNTLARVDDALPGPGSTGAGGAHGTIADYAPVYGVVERLVGPGPGSVLELGSCFGFLSLRLAARGLAVTASDLSPGTISLLAAVAPRLGVDVAALVADAARVPWPAGSVDTVLAIHLLEHVDAAHGRRILDEAIRVARHRVVVAVPLEDEADETWGHVRTISLADLDAWGAATGHTCTVAEDHGGWLVIDL